MNYFYLTDSGRVRDHNEDNVIIVKNDANEYLLAVADGMGGHLCGEVASSIAIKHVAERFKKISSIGNKEDAENWIQSTVSEVNALIYKYTEEHPESKGMGTTFVCAILTNDFLLYGNIGDSSGFAIKGDKIQKITNDHTLVSLLVKAGDLTEEEASEHPKKNVLLKALGATTTVDMDIFDVETDIDGILLCSDGMTNMLDKEQILKVIKENIPVEERLKKLIDKCNNRGGTDNISVAYLEKGVEL
jgi:protein phosphatase